MSNRPAAFLDRDGVINEDRGYVHRIEDFVFLPGVMNALRQLARANYALVIITNQSGIGRGYFTEDDFATLNHEIICRLALHGIRLDAIFYCPHAPNDAVCSCRKPEPGLLLQAAQELKLDLGRSFMVGDKASDIEAGRRAGVGRCFLIGSEPAGAADAAFASLGACSRFLTARSLP